MNESTSLSYPGDQQEILLALENLTHISQGSDYEDMQIKMLQAICKILDAETGALALVDEERGLIYKKSLLPTGWLYQASKTPGEGIIQTCLRTGQPLLVNNTTASPHFAPDFDAVEGLPAHSILCVPLAVRGKTLGAIEVINKQSGSFTRYDQDLLALFANLTAHSLDGIRLVQQLKIANTSLQTSHWELFRSRNTLRALFDSMPAAIYIIDRAYKLVAINMSCANRAGKLPQNLVGRQCYSVLYHRQEACPDCKVLETLQDARNTNRTERRMRKDEEPTEWEISTYPILDENDLIVVQAILLEQDVTEKRRMEGIIAQSEKLAAVGELAAGVAHEINNPLTAIIANAQILKREMPPDEELLESVELIERAGSRASQVVKNLLDFARKEDYELAPNDINETLRKALALVQHELVSRSIRLDFEPAANLPQIKTSKDHLQGVWLNLLMNAIDTIGEEKGKIQITTTRAGNEIRVSFTDNGQGIPPERLPRIFEPFYTTKAPGRGTGLGLSVCHRIVKQHGGDIQVDSQVGVGSVFTVILPVS